MATGPVKEAPDENASSERPSRDTRSNRIFNELSCPGFYLPKDIQEIWNYQAGRCHFCLEMLGPIGTPRAFVKDHLIPVSNPNGTFWPDNIALTCEPCNADKHYRTETAYWNSLKKTLPADRYSDLRVRASELRKKKIRLTKRNRRDRARGLNDVEIAILERLTTDLRATGPDDIRLAISVDDNEDDAGITIVINCVIVDIPNVRGGSHALKRWFRKYSDTLADGLLNLHALSPRGLFAHQ